ncbi:hypothetical protein Ancab_024060, partial [Ancistrocladus abbreviatus]
MSDRSEMESAIRERAGDRRENHTCEREEDNSGGGGGGNGDCERRHAVAWGRRLARDPLALDGEEVMEEAGR